MGCASFEANTQTSHLRELAFARIRRPETWVLHTYGLLPTDPRFQDLRAWECEYLYWSHLMWHRIAKRTAEKLPIDQIEHLLEEEIFEEKLAQLEAADSARMAEAAATPLPPVEPVSHWTASEPAP